MPFIRLFTNVSKDKLPLQFMPCLCQEFAQVLNKDPAVFNWILETDKTMSKGPDSEGIPYIWMEIRALKVFDSQEDCRSHAPKLFESVTKLTGFKQEQVHILMGPLQPWQLGVNGATKG